MKNVDFTIIILAVPVAEWIRALIFHYCTEPFNHLTAVSGVGSIHTQGTCKTSQVLLAGVPSFFFLGVLPFSPHLLFGPSHMS